MNTVLAATASVSAESKGRGKPLLFSYNFIQAYKTVISATALSDRGLFGRRARGRAAGEATASPIFYSVREKCEPRLWRYLFGILLLIFLAILGYCCVIASRQGAFCESSAYAKHCALIACRSSFSKFFIKNFEKKLRCSPKVQSNQKRQDGRPRRGEARRACPVARSRASTMRSPVSAFDRVCITPLHYPECFAVPAHRIRG